jgi:D-beta-D-heptose 7-phosphate kinase / D-beta-D-heptose 1-phosphate adenosyltransferase
MLAPAASEPELARLLASHRAAGRRVVCTNGCFDVLHRGHLAYLEQARRLGDVLVVGVNDDASVRRLKGPGRPVNPAEDRAAVLAALACVNHVAIFGGDTAAELVEFVRPDVYVKGADYAARVLPEAAVVARYGGEVRLLELVPNRSTSAIIERIRAV